MKTQACIKMVVLTVLLLATVQADTFVLDICHPPQPTESRWKSGKTIVTLSKDGTLRVRGRGAMQNYGGYWAGNQGGCPPWAGVPSRVIIKRGVTHIGNAAFDLCTNLTSITIPNSVTSIGRFALNGAASLPVTIPASVTSIELQALSGTSSINVVADNPNYSSKDGVLFNKNKTTLIQYPKQKPGASYIIPGSVISIGDAAFKSCSLLTSVIIPNSVTYIGASAFAYSGLTSIDIPNSVTTIREMAFRLVCLMPIIIPIGVVEIGWGAFSFLCQDDNDPITVIALNPIPPKIGKDAFCVADELGCLYVPKNSIAAYSSAEHWKDFKCIKAIP